MERKTQECPFCSSVIKKNAKKCPYCKSVLSPVNDETAAPGVGSFLRSGILYALSILIVLGSVAVGINFYTEHGQELRNEEYERILLDAENHYMSRERFLNALENIGFSRAEAYELSDECGIDWNEQAVRCLHEKIVYYSENGLPILPEAEMFNYLVKFHLFTEEEAQYAIDTVYK